MQNRKPHLSHTAQQLLMGLLLIAIGLAVYQYATTLPLFWDDIFQFASLQRVNIGQVLTTRVAEWSTFRPLSFATWKLLYDLQGAYDPFALHLLNVVLHGINGCLVALIVSRQSQVRPLLTGMLAGLLFLLFPFGFQAIAPVNSLMHPLHVCFILLSVLLYQISHNPNHLGVRALSVLVAGAAVLVHENGVLSAGIVTLIAILNQPRPTVRRLLTDVLPYWLSVLVFFLIWRSPPGGGNPFSLSVIFGNMESRLQNAAYFLQAFASPFSALATPLHNLLPLTSDLISIALISVPVCIAWLMLAWRGKQGRLALLGAAWFALAALPAILMLPFSYVLESPRLLYLASVGAAIFWVAPLAGIWTKPTIQRIYLLLTALVLVVSLTWDGLYLQRRAVLYTQMGQAIQQLQSSSITPECAAQSTTPTLLINFPAWYFVPQVEYLIGHDGITALSEGQSLDELYRINFGVKRSFSTATLPDIMPAKATFVGLGNARTVDDLQPLVHDAGATFVYQSTSAGMRLRSMGCHATSSNATQVAQSTIGQQVSLLSSSINTNTQRNELMVTLEWQLLKPVTEDITVFAQALDGSGKLIAQSDGYPLGGTSPMRLWQAGERWFDTRYITLPDAALLNTARVVVGVYSTGNGQRLTAVDSAGQRLPDDAVEVHR